MTIIANSKNVNYYIITIFCGIISTVLIGFLFFGLNIFDKQITYFQFPIFGIVGSVSFVLFRMKKFRYSILILALLFLFEIIIAGEKYFVTQFLFFVAIVLSILIFTQYYYTKLDQIKYSRPFVLSGIISVTYIIITVMLEIIFTSESTDFYSFQSMPIGFLIGIGLGIGFELSEFLQSNFA